ncbi:MAG: hypothetical protein ABI980_12840 [Nitrospirota bacterium]
MRQALLNRNGVGSVSGQAIPLLAALFVLASCSTQFDMSGERIARPGPEWGVVIGSVVVQPETHSSEKPSTVREASSNSFEFDIAQIQLSDPDGTHAYAKQYRLNTKTGEERTFISRLPPGQYLIRNFQEEGMVGLAGDLDLVFTVAPGEIRYIGRVHVVIPRHTSSGKPYRFAVENARETTLAMVSKQHPELTSAVVDGPLKLRQDPVP